MKRNWKPGTEMQELVQTLDVLRQGDQMMMTRNLMLLMHGPVECCEMAV
jgi:hypothetical protein